MADSSTTAIVQQPPLAPPPAFATISVRDFLTYGWNIGAAVTVGLPMLAYIIAVLVRGPIDDERSQDESSSSSWKWWGNDDNNNNNDDDDNNNQSNNDDQSKNGGSGGGWWWSSSNNEDERRREENQGKGAVIFAYIWTLVMFGTLVWYGNKVFRRNAHPLPLVSAMVVFWNMSFIGVFLVGNVGINYEERQLEEQGWLSQFGACLTITYFCLLIYFTVFILWIRRRMKSSAIAENSVVISRPQPVVTNDYYHQDSDGSRHLEQREPSTSNKPPWAAFY